MCAVFYNLQSILQVFSLIEYEVLISLSLSPVLSDKTETKTIISNIIQMSDRESMQSRLLACHLEKHFTIERHILLIQNNGESRYLFES